VEGGELVDGWIKLHRKMLDNPVVCKDSDHLAVWVYLLLNATHDEYPALFKGQKVMLKPGQLLTGRKSISSKLNIDESKIQRILKSLKNEQQIEQQASNRNRLITIVNWKEYQNTEQQNAQQVNNKRTTDEQQMNTNKNVKNDKNDKNKPPYPLTEFDFSNPLQEKVQEWLTYKTEKKDTYKPTGFKSLMLKIQKQAAEYGDQAVMDLIDECMAANWKGIVWDKLQQRKNDRSGNPFKEALRKELEYEQNRGNSNNDRYQGGLSKLLQEPGRGQ